MSASTKAIRIAILAMGGEGGGVLANWLVDLGEHNGYIAQLTSVPGVAQRTGATIYYLELFPASAAKNGRAPVLALMPVPGDVDIVIASELMEAGRAIQRGIVTPDRTTLIASTNRVYAMTEKIVMDDGRVEEAKILEACQIAAKRLVAMDMSRIADQSGSHISAVMFGAVAGAGVLPFERSAFEATITRGGVGGKATERAFALAFDAARSDAPVTLAQQEAAPLAPASVSDEPAVAALLVDARATLPGVALDFAEEGIRRAADYQDSEYAKLYLSRLKEIATFDRDHGDGSRRLTVEAARQLALAMTYEDTIRVAELKTQRDRFDRVAAEVGLRDGQIVEIAEFLHPRLQEIAETVPERLGRFLLGNPIARKLVSAMTQSGRVVKTTSITGFLMMRAVASRKPHRRGTMRYAEEQAGIDAWLADVKRAAAFDPSLALELVECRNLVKGYGDTHARGKANYAAIVAEARKMSAGDSQPAAIAALRKAANADDSGAKLREAIASRAARAAAAAESKVTAFIRPAE